MNFLKQQSYIASDGTQDLYIRKKAAANICVIAANKAVSTNTSICRLNRLDCANNYTKCITPVDSSVRTENIQQGCALTTLYDSKLCVSNKIRHGGVC